MINKWLGKNINSYFIFPTEEPFVYWVKNLLQKKMPFSCIKDAEAVVVLDFNSLQSSMTRTASKLSYFLFLAELHFGQNDTFRVSSWNLLSFLVKYFVILQIFFQTLKVYLLYCTAACRANICNFLGFLGGKRLND
jgi:hypothetical protein